MEVKVFTWSWHARNNEWSFDDQTDFVDKPRWESPLVSFGWEDRGNKRFLVITCRMYIPLRSYSPDQAVELQRKAYTKIREVMEDLQDSLDVSVLEVTRKGVGGFVLDHRMLRRLTKEEILRGAGIRI